MALNIVAHRKVSLKGFAEGWDDCFLTVKAMNPDQMERARELVRGEASDDDKEEAALQLLRDVVVGGTVIDTKEDGTSTPVSVELADVPYVVSVLGTAWQLEVLMVAGGLDRLKARS